MSTKPSHLHNPTISPSTPETNHRHPPQRLPKSLLLATWLLAFSTLTIAASSIAFIVQAKDFIDTTDMRLNALSNNTLGIYAALAGDEDTLRAFAGYRGGIVGTSDSVSMRRALYNIMDEITDVNGN
ncbi:hypothetical protein BDW62DRAFT_189489 [Aspergillus aurantiobrunneus]